MIYYKNLEAVTGKKTGEVDVPVSPPVLVRPIADLTNSIGLRRGFRPEVAAEPGAAHQARIVHDEIGLNGVERHIGERAAVAQIFHVPPTSSMVARLEKPVGLAVEFERFDADAFAQRAIESRASP